MTYLMRPSCVAKLNKLLDQDLVCPNSYTSILTPSWHPIFRKHPHSLQPAIHHIKENTNHFKTTNHIPTLFTIKLYKHSFIFLPNAIITTYINTLTYPATKDYTPYLPTLTTTQHPCDIYRIITISHTTYFAILHAGVHQYIIFKPFPPPKNNYINRTNTWYFIIGDNTWTHPLTHYSSNHSKNLWYYQKKGCSYQYSIPFFNPKPITHHFIYHQLNLSNLTYHHIISLVILATCNTSFRLQSSFLSVTIRPSLSLTHLDPYLIKPLKLPHNDHRSSYELPRSYRLVCCSCQYFYHLSLWYIIDPIITSTTSNLTR